MDERIKQKRKVVIVGAGSVGSTYGYSLAQSGLADEIVILDKNGNLARGQAMDLSHGEPYFPMVSILPGSSLDYSDADLVVITAGAAQKPGESRLDLLKKNAEVVKEVIHEMISMKSRAVVLMVTNPVDIMTFVALQESGWSRNRVFGSGTVLDSARLRQMLSVFFNIDVHNVHGYILGEHGDSEFAAWSLAHIAGMPVDSYCRKNNLLDKWKNEKIGIEKKVRESAYHIIGYKGATCFGVGMALVRITQAILRGQNSVLTVSTLFEGEYGIKDTCLSLPCRVSSGGIENIILGELEEDEKKSLENSSLILQKAIKDLGY